MTNIHTLNKIAEVGLNIFSKAKYNTSAGLDECDGVLVRSASMHECEVPQSLKAVARAGAGVNNIPVEEYSKQGIVVFNTPGANANAVKELTIAGLLISSRKVVEGIDWAKSLSGDDVASLVEKGKGAFVGPELFGKTLGIIGLGAIGVLVANAAHYLGMDVVAYDPYISVDAAWIISRSVRRAKSAQEVYEVADYISIHAPLNKDTKHSINSSSIEVMKDGVRILNFSRGELVNNFDILTALDSGKVSTYVTDFPCEQLLNKKGVICIPHLGASTPESEDNCAIMACRQLLNFLESGSVVNSVNLPTVEMPLSDKVRITVIHKNMPNMLVQISSAFATQHINISDMLNKSKKDIAYTMLDVDDDVNGDILEHLQKIDGVIRTRLIMP